MHRFPNPGSDIDSFIRIFQALFEELGYDTEFSLDDISTALINKNLASSSGYMGNEALSRSYNKDRSRDKLYNQSKMYAELFRSLGWFRTTKSRLNFSFSYLGIHLATSKNQSSKLLMEESLLGMAFPNEVIDVKGNYNFRPFLCILRTIVEMGGVLCRDEIIAGPQSILNDRDQKDFDSMINQLKLFRSGKGNIKDYLKDISEKRNISLVTMGNYTRFPLAVLDWTGWTTKERRSDILPGNNHVFHVITDYGKKRFDELIRMKDIRCSDMKNFTEKTQKSISRISFFGMLSRSGFDTSLFNNSIKDESEFLPKNLQKNTILFSPFQELKSEKLDLFFSDFINLTNSLKFKPRKNPEVFSLGSKDDVLVTTDITPKLLATKNEPSDSFCNITNWIKTNLEMHSNHTDAVDKMMEDARLFNKDSFYPLVSDIFKLLGMNCEISRHGVNYQRWDGIILLEQDSIPIEIKSPSEEIYISIKSVRQALENKVILLSRNSYPNIRNTTSLVVGYLLPNNRSEVTGLINDINKTYNINIGIIDLKSLLFLTILKIKYRKIITSNQIKRINGLINVKNF